MAIKKIAAVVMIVSLPFLAAFADDLLPVPLKFSRNEPATPRLTEPIKETVSLAGRKSLVFRWENPGAIDVRHWVFRLYRGFNMYAPDLVLEEHVPGNKNMFEVPAERFGLGQVYSWSLVRVNLDGRKSEKVFSSFTVVNR